MTKRFWIGAVLAVPVFILAMAHLIPALGRQHWVNGDASALAAICAHHVCGLLGRLAAFQTWLALHSDVSLEHVHADRNRRGRGLRLQRGGNAFARPLSDYDAARGQGRHLL